MLLLLELSQQRVFVWLHVFFAYVDHVLGLEQRIAAFLAYVEFVDPWEQLVQLYLVLHLVCYDRRVQEGRRKRYTLVVLWLGNRTEHLLDFNGDFSNQQARVDCLLNLFVQQVWLVSAFLQLLSGKDIRTVETKDLLRHRA